MVIPRVGIVDGRVVVEGGGVKFEAPISDAPSAESPTITVDGKIFRPKEGRMPGRGRASVSASEQAKIASERQREGERILAEKQRAARQRATATAKREQIESGRITGQLEERGLNEQFGTRTDFIPGRFDIGDKRELVLSRDGTPQLIGPPSKTDVIIATLGLGGAVKDDTFIIPDVIKEREFSTTSPSLFGQGTITPDEPVSEDIFINIGQVKPLKKQPSGFDFGQGTNIQTDFGAIDLSSIPPLITQPSIVRRRIDEGGGIPTFQDVFVDPTKTGRPSERLLTKQEFKAIEEAEQILIIPEEKTGLGGVEDFFAIKRQDVQTGRASGLDIFLGGIGAGFISSVIGSARFAGALATDPLGTGKQFLGSLKDIPKGLTTIGQLLLTEPGFIGGFALGEFAQFKGGQFALKGLKRGATGIKDIVRTRGLQEIPLESITVSEPFAQAPFGTSGKQLTEFFKQQRVVTKGGVNKIIQLPGEVIGDGGVRVFTASKSGPRGQSFIAGFGSSREPGPFFSPQLSKEFLGKGISPQTKFFGFGGLDEIFSKKGPIAFRTTLSAVEELPEGLLKARRVELSSGFQTGFKGFATPAEQSIISFRASFQDPTKAIVSTRFSFGGGEIEAIGRAGAVFEKTSDARFFSKLPGGRRFIIEDIAPTGAVLDPADLVKRARGTAVVRTPKGILLTFSPEELKFVLPGGGVDVGETALKATGRELFEETGLKATGLEFVGSIEGPIKRFGARRPKFRFVKETFEVFETKTTGVAKPTGEVKQLGFFKPGSSIDISDTTRQILELTGDIKKGSRRGSRASTSLSIDVGDLGKGQFSIEDLTKVSRESFSVSSRALITPQSLLGSSILLGGAGSSGFKLPTRRQNLSDIFRDTIIISKQEDIIPTGVRRGDIGRVGGGSSFPRSRRQTTPPITIPPLFPNLNDPLGEEKISRLRKSADSKKKKKFKEKKLRRRIDPLAPSLTGLALFDLADITGGPLLKSGSLGRSPSQLRLVPRDLVGSRRNDLSFFTGSQPRRRNTRRKKK